MRAVVIGNGDIKSYEYIKSKLRHDDYIICADGGLKHTDGLGVVPDIAIGDFDSSQRREGVKAYVYPTRKDYTDGELAVRYALDKGFNDIVMLAMTGTRLDHTITNITLMSLGEGICLIDDDNELRIVKTSLTLKDCKGKTLSIIPIYGNMEGVTTSGLEYPLCGETLYFGESRGNSNVITEDICTISVKSGMGIVSVCNGL